MGRCTDPGTPGGAVQDVKSYEAGQLLSFKCLRPGYEPVPSAPLMCQQGVNVSKWNNVSLPLCTGEHIFFFYQITVNKMKVMKSYTIYIILVHLDQFKGSSELF